jgi:hypothetical protein
MTDETTQAAAPAEEAVFESPIIDLDAVEAPVEVKDEETTEEEAPQPGGEETPDEKPKKLSGSQRAKIREARLLAELNETQRKLEEISRSTPTAKASESEVKPPREEDYNGDYFAWQRALTAFEAGKAAREAIAEQFKSREDSERTTKQSEIARERSIAHLERVEDAREVIGDFDQVMKAMDGVQVRQDVIDEIMSSEKSALLAYHLAKNPDKLQSLNSMSGRELAREMGRLEGSVRMPASKLQTSAPAPLSTLKGGASPQSQDGILDSWLKKTYGK